MSVTTIENIMNSAPASSAPSWPEPLASGAFYGLAGEVVQTIEPHSEADPTALLIQFLAAFGSAVGRNPHFTVEADRHGANLFAVLVGETAKGRKGTSFGQAKRVVTIADDAWKSRIVSGLSSGEGLIHQVRDPVEQQQPIKEKGKVTGYQTVIVDEGVADKRLLVVEGEFARALRVLGRDGNTLSAIIRAAWDTGDLRTLIKSSPARATGAHISILGHITRPELLRYLDDIEAGNGFANRFLWVCVKRSKVLPEGGALTEEELTPLAQDVRDALEFARGCYEVRRDEMARAIWHRVYPELSEGRPGLVGAVTARAEAQVMRLALIYALLDRTAVIGPAHLNAALALWEYTEASARWVFGDLSGDPVADRIITALRQTPEGLTRTDISNLFGRNVTAQRIENALGELHRAGKAQVRREGTDGRSSERWLIRV